MNQPTTQQQLDLDEIEARAAALHEYATLTEPDAQPGFDQLTGTDVPALIDELRRLSIALNEIRHLHKDSPMGPCPVCIDADAIAEGRDGLMPYPCPTGRLAGAQDCDPPAAPAAAGSAAANEDGQPTTPTAAI